MGRSIPFLIPFTAACALAALPGVAPAQGPAERIAAFDNDGTLWSEQPIYFQLAFALDQVKSLAPKHPEWKTTQPFKAVLEGDSMALAGSGQNGLVELVIATHTGMTTDEFTNAVDDWLATARHPASSDRTPIWSTSRCWSY